MVCQRSTCNSIASCDAEIFSLARFFSKCRVHLQASFRARSDLQEVQAMRFYAVSLRNRFAVAAAILIAIFGVSVTAEAQNIEWVRQFGTATRDEGTAVAKGPSGVYVTGNTIGVFPG